VLRGARLILRGTRLFAVTLVWASLVSVRQLTAGLGANAGDRRRRARRHAMRGWCRGLCRALGVRLEVHGEPPREPCFLVCNHLSYLDIPVLGSLFDTIFVSKAEVAFWPVIGRLATLGGTIYVDRTRKRGLPEVNEQIRSALEHGDGVVVFPEGTSSAGETVLPFRASLLAPAVDLGLAVRQAGLVYATGPGDPPAGESVSWWGGMSFGTHVLGLLRLASIRATVTFVGEPVRCQDRKELAQTLWQGVSDAIKTPT
jgi:1-acyl-sn-glycerol-3-phosphate acyltransferase